MIRSFANTPTKTERIWSGLRSPKLPPDVQRRALAKLLMLDAATSLDDLKFSPSNGLHELRDDRRGQHAISINKKYRMCFVWNNGDAYDVEIVDCH
jgi:proteic killer suppression protein